MFDLIIIGTGPAGLTAALYASLYGLNTLAIGDMPGGKLINAPDIIDYPGIESIHGREFIQHLTSQLKRTPAILKQQKVISVSFDQTTHAFKIHCESSETYTSSALILATGNGNKQKENAALKFSTNLGITHQNGYIEVDGAGTTSLEGVFAAGDCIAFPESLEQLSTAVSSGIRASAGAYTHLKKEKPPILWGTAKIPRL